MRRSRELKLAGRALGLAAQGVLYWYSVKIGWAVLWIVLEVALLLVLWLVAMAFLVLHGIFWEPSFKGSCILSLLMGES